MPPGRDPRDGATMGAMPVAEPLLDDPTIDRLRAAFHRAAYNVASVVEVIGEAEHAALGRNQTGPGLRSIGHRHEPVATFAALWPLQGVVGRREADAALPGLIGSLAAAGILATDADSVRALVDIRPYASDTEDAWIVSDLSPGLDGQVTPMTPDFVLGVSSASTSLAQLTSRRPVPRALDLGTGCGVQSLHLRTHSDTVVATDLNHRALRHADLSCRLSGVPVDLREGSLYEPVAGEEFDLIVTNPPYVMSPPEAARLIYRESAFTGDGLVEAVVRDGITHLAPGGLLQVLGNWMHPVAGDWAERLRGWVAGTGCDLHVVERERLDPYEYIELWLADAGLTGAPDYRERYDAWLAYFDRLGVAAVGLGWISVHRSGRAEADLTVEEWPHAVEQPIAAAIDERRDRLALLRDLDGAELLARRWVLADDVVQETTGPPGAPDPEHVAIRRQRGFRRAVAVDTALAGVVGACDGDLELGRIIAAVASLLSVDAAGLAAELVPTIRELIMDGFLRSPTVVGSAG